MIIEDFTNSREKLYLRENHFKNPRGAVLIVHGAGEHIGRYDYVQRKLEERGFASMGCDLRGHGRSGGKRCHINFFDEYIEDVYETFKVFEEKYSTIPKFILGHSMGGLITLRFCELYGDKFKGVGVSSPLLGFKIPVGRGTRNLANFLSLILPTFSFNNGIKPYMVSRTEEIVKGYGTDHYVYGKITARWFTEISKAMESTLMDADKLTYPIIVLQAEADLLVDPVKTEYFYNNCGSKDKYFELFKGFYHELMNEPERDMIIDKYIEFFEKRI